MEVVPMGVNSHKITRALESTEILIVDEPMLEKVLGPPKFDDSEAADRVSTPGVAVGLVWTAFGGEVQFVEATAMLGKGDPRIVAMYDKLLVSKDLWAIGEQLRANCLETKNMLLQFTGHKDLLEGDPYLKQWLRLRDSYITTLNVCQAYTLKRIRDPNYHVNLRPHLSKESSTKPEAELV